MPPFVVIEAGEKKHRGRRGEGVQTQGGNTFPYKKEGWAKSKRNENKKRTLSHCTFKRSAFPFPRKSRKKSPPIHLREEVQIPTFSPSRKVLFSLLTLSHIVRQMHLCSCMHNIFFLPSYNLLLVPAGGHIFRS